jgi:hypothetical protein
MCSSSLGHWLLASTSGSTLIWKGALLWIKPYNISISQTKERNSNKEPQASWWGSFMVLGTKVAPFSWLLWGVLFHCLRRFFFPYLFSFCLRQVWLSDSVLFLACFRARREDPWAVVSLLGNIFLPQWCLPDLCWLSTLQPLSQGKF